MSDESGFTPPAPAPAAAGGPDAPNAKLWAILGWIFAPIGIIALFMDDTKNNVWVRQHVIQAAAVALIGWVLSTFTFGIVSMLLWFYQLYIALAKANKGESVEVPVVYGVVKNMIDNV